MTIYDYENGQPGDMPYDQAEQADQPVIISDKERAEWLRLREQKAWGPRFTELDAKVRRAATDAWRRADVFGELDPDAFAGA